jgi:hypothetical protein
LRRKSEFWRGGVSKDLKTRMTEELGCRTQAL